ncbi:MAG: GspE/PulE family protein [Desulfobacterales bacterium]|jgi:type II secretory ATPase GspE/PulE/Tfp pilus assembly ATPase PilB-like protein|nr:GspE/PulE family protein [Desulfobacterales bacterium]
MHNTSKALSLKPADVRGLKDEVEYREKLHTICNMIHAAKDIDDILIRKEKEITALFQAERLTVYTIDGITDRLVSRFKSGDEIKAIDLPVSTASIAGHAAFKHKLINVYDVRDKDELTKIHPQLQFDPRWDAQSGYTTKQVLAHPIVFKKYLLGALQVINRKNNSRFDPLDESAIRQLADTFGIALYNQKRMRKFQSHRYQYLIDTQQITEAQLQKAAALARKEQVPMETILIDTFHIGKKDLGRSLSQYHRVPFVEFQPGMEKPRALMKGLKVPFLRKNAWVPLRIENGVVIIAVSDPNNLEIIDEIKAVFSGRALRFFVSLRQDIMAMIDLFADHLKEPAPIDDILVQLEADLPEVELQASDDYSERDSTVVQLVNKIILDALEQGASDIHIEPYSGVLDTQIRFRVDGICRLYRNMPSSYKKAIVSRIKVMADLDIAERRRPQDGKIRFGRFGKESVELRVATIPTQGDVEDVVIRLLSNEKPLPLEAMDFKTENLENFIRAIERPYGIIFVCGPTGSGKTTTLHAALNRINDVTKKIWTAEDPVELTQKGLRQVQVQPKIHFDFAAAMRAFLRADPDVIMVGEMRDRETARIGIEASLTGHLVFSTLHTNNAPESIVRLLDMGMDPFNFSDAVICILAQRLMPRLCEKCKQPVHPRPADFEALVREYGEELFHRHVGVDFSTEMVLYKPGGCSKCRRTGYSGRMALHELLMGTDDIKRLIQTGASVEAIRAQAIKDGMTTLKQDGIEKVLAGHCDMAQVRKVCIK